jgi:membrane protein YqaA with SNARE-associated domain
VPFDLLTLLLWSFLASTILPLGSEPALAAIVNSRGTIALPVTIATIGNYLGACTTYALAFSATRVVKSERATRRLERASKLINKYGAPALLLSWVPLIGDAIVAAAGVARMPFLPFSLWTVVGKAARYAALAVVVDRALS